MSGVPLIVFLMVSIFAVGNVTSCNTRGYTNGCSIPFGLNYFYSKEFTPDCHKHDVCYACGEKYGITRKTCDDVFFRNILRRCRSNSNVRSTTFCRLVTTDYYFAVRLGGWARYEDNALYWCSQSWVTGCIL